VGTGGILMPASGASWNECLSSRDGMEFFILIIDCCSTIENIAHMHDVYVTYFRYS
jgi:hypothetical protein